MIYRVAKGLLGNRQRFQETVYGHGGVVDGLDNSNAGKLLMRALWSDAAQPHGRDKKIVGKDSCNWLINFAAPKHRAAR